MTGGPVFTLTEGFFLSIMRKNPSKEEKIMKKMICMLLAVLLLLTGCKTAAPSESTAPAESAEPAETAPTFTQEEPTMPIQDMPNLDIGGEEGEELAFRNPGKVRLAYTGNRSYIQYITDLDQLPDEEALKDYDEAFFEKSALVVVVETVGSGSVQLEIESIHITEGTATVTLKRSMPGEMGTNDMATWMLWAEVDKNLDYEWVLEGGSNQPQGEKY
jgi:uncharacterized protein YceK